MHKLLATLIVVGAIIPAVAFATVEGGAEAPTTTTTTTKTVVKKRTCETKACHARVASKKKAKIRASCKSKTCKARVAKKQIKKQRLAYIAGYQGWLAKVRDCESTNNYRAISASGKYRGAYQFDFQTWASVGGSGDPAAASPLEQDYRAVKLLKSQGASPWPVCG